MLAKALFPALFSAPLTSNLRGDVLGALSATLVGVPLAIAYGMIAVSTLGPDWAGIGALASLFGCALTGLLCALLGGNPVNIVGPRAATLLVFAALTGRFLHLPGVEQNEAVAFGCLAVALAGLIQLGLGLVRLGRLADFIPYPVIAGFMNGTGLLIMVSQIRPLFGQPPAAALLWAVTLLAMMLAARMSPRLPSMLAGLGVGIVLYQAARLAGLDAMTLGGTLPPLPAHLQTGLISIGTLQSALHDFPASAIRPMVTSALSMAALATLDTMLTTLTIDQLTRRHSDPNRELAAQGVANGLAGLLGMLPCAGSMARTAPLVRAGGRTALAAILSAAMVAGVAVLLAPAVRFLPQAVMSAALTLTGFSILDRWTMDTLRRLRWSRLADLPHADLLAMTAVVASTLLFGVVVSVGVGMAVSLAFFLLRMSRSPIRRHYSAAALAMHVQDDAERLAFIRRHGQNITIIELSGVLFFGSVATLQRQVEGLIAQGMRYVVLDLKRVIDLDLTAARVIERLHVELDRAGGRLILAYLDPERRRGLSRQFEGEERRLHATPRHLWRVLDQAGTLHPLDDSQLTPDLDTAVLACEHHILGDRRDSGEAPLASAILSGLDRQSMRRLRPYLSRRRFVAGDLIFRQGDPPDSIYFVASGRVDVTINLPRTDRKLRVRTLARGAIFGEMAIIDPKPRSASVTVTEPGVCYRLSAGDFERLKQSEADIAFRLLENTGRIFVERLRASNLMIAELET